MVEDIKVNDYPVVISVSHVTRLGEVWKGSRFIAECRSMGELNKILNSLENQPEPHWQWCIDFQDKVEDNDPS